jgi:hypothetical protein
MLNTVTSTTPGPNVYSKVGTLENDDPNKHFGFLSKSDRFQTASTLPDEENDASGRNSPVEAAFRRPLPKEFRGEKEEITKLKKEVIQFNRRWIGSMSNMSVLSYIMTRRYQTCKKNSSSSTLNCNKQSKKKIPPTPYHNLGKKN